MAVGKVFLIGAGPGDPGLITVRGVEALGEAEVVLYDALAHVALLEHASPTAELRNVGKRYGEDSFSQTAINAELVALGRAGKIVARLKGGDPLLFARGAEEIETLAEAKIPFEIIPGNHLSDWRLGLRWRVAHPPRSVLERRLHHRDRKPRKRADSSRLVQARDRNADVVRHHGDEAARPRSPRRSWPTVATGRLRPWSCSGARGPSQRVVEGTVGDIAARAAEAQVANPSVVIIGEVARLRDRMRWFDAGPFSANEFSSRVPSTGAETAPAMRERGAEPVVVPVIEIVPPPDVRAVRAPPGRLRHLRCRRIDQRERRGSHVRRARGSRS